MQTEKIKKLLLVISSIALCCILAGSWIIEKEKTKTMGYTDPEKFSGIFVPADENDGLDFDVKGYLAGSGVYIFLPCTADISHVVFYSTDADGNYLQRFVADFSSSDTEIAGIHVTAMQSKLPSVSIEISENAPSLDDLEASENHSVKTYASMELVSLTDEKYVSKIEMRGRGNISWLEDKKSYQIKTSKALNLLNMGSAKEWILLANAADYSLLRNEVFLGMAADMGLEYTPEIQETDLFINGEYRGTYSLCTKVEKGINRVNIGKEDYLYRIGMDPDKYSFLIPGTGEEPEYGELRDVKDEGTISESETYLINILNEMYDPESDLDNIDLTSFAKYYWLQEFSKTTDPTGRSVYFYWIKNENKMYMGPAWDYDRSAGTISMPLTGYDYLWPDGYTARYEDYYVPLFKNKKFTEAVKDVYFNGGVREAFQKASEELPYRIANISESAKMNFIRWPGQPDDIDNKVAYAYGDTSYDSQTAWLSDWISMRSEWISSEMEGEGD